MSEITEDSRGMLENAAGKSERLEMVTITREEYIQLQIDEQLTELMADSWKILAKKLIEALPAEQFRELLLEAVMSYYKEYDDFEADNMAHWMQKEFGFKMYEVDEFRNEELKDSDYFH